MNKFLLVGERPSPRAVEIGARWTNWKLSGRTLRDALISAGIVPKEQSYRNLYVSSVRGAASDRADEARAVRAILRAARRGYTVVGMGRLVQAVLERSRVPHLQMKHPAVRGVVRRKSIYQEHCFDVLVRRVPHYQFKCAPTHDALHSRSLSEPQNKRGGQYATAPKAGRLR